MPNETSPNFKDISDETQLFLNIWLVSVTETTLASFSMITNMVNMAIFVYQGLKECMNFNLFCLAVCDFLATAFVLGFSLVFVAQFIVSDTSVDSVSLMMIIFAWRNLFADLGSGFIVFISLERCLCVTLPFKFKSFFTIRNTRIIIGGITLFVMVNYIPAFFINVLVRQFDPFRNATILSLAPSEIRTVIYRYHNYVFAIGLTVTCQACVFVCAVLMFKGLSKSSGVRAVTSTGALSRSTKQSALSSKEKRLVKMVFLVAVCYLLTGIPQVFIGLALVIFPEFSYYPNLGMTVGSLGLMLGSANGCANIFIYYRFNTSYKMSFLYFFGCDRQRGE